MQNTGQFQDLRGVFQQNWPKAVFAAAPKRSFEMQLQRLNSVDRTAKPARVGCNECLGIMIAISLRLLLCRIGVLVAKKYAAHYS